MILALDLGTKTGWAKQTSCGDIVSGTECFKTNRYEGAGMRYLRFSRWLTEIKQSGVSEVYYEEVRSHAGTDAAHVYGAYQGALMAWCEKHTIPYQSVPVGTIKRFATNKGNASKEMMIKAAEKCGYEVDDDNQADAIHLLRYIIDKIETSKEVLSKVC